jgi:hypothetical protein
VPMTPLAIFIFEALLMALLWFAMAALGFFLWRRAKSSGHLVMLGGAGFLGLHNFFWTFGSFLIGGFWGQFIGVAVLVFGFWLTVKPLVAADVAMILGKIGVKPPPAPAAPGTPPHGSTILPPPPTTKP